jgi:hypothetical protein
MAAAHGTPEKFHATLTSGWAHCVAVHRERWGADTFDGFLKRNPRLLDSRLLEHFFSPTQLLSDEARAAVVDPDLRALPTLTV